MRGGADMRQPRVVLDTNCLVSALLFANSRLSPLRACWRASRFVPLGCKETIQELIRVLAYPKFKLSQEEIEALLEDLLPYMVTHAVENANAPIAGLRDPHDAVFLHLAGQAGADMLVSGDEDILVLGDAVTDFAILSPAAFLASLEYSRAGQDLK
jgi:putative PIN family toxin of toxin-antitoxin system